MTYRLFPAFAVALALGLTAPLAAFADSAPRTITVTGEGLAARAPDRATVTIGVREDAASAAEALRQMSAGLGPVLDHLAEIGVAATDMQTSGLGLDARYVYPEGEEPRLVGYAANSTLTVRLRDMEQVGAVLDAVVQEGANRVAGISFGLADPASARDEARRAAVADARARAGLYAEAAGVALGEVLTISESGGSGPGVPMAAVMRDSAAVPVAGGEVEMTARVTVVFAIE